MRRSRSSPPPARSPGRRVLAAAVCLLTTAGVAAAVATPATAAPARSAQPSGLSQTTVDQIAALQAVKRSQSGVETRVDSRLLVAERQARGRSLPGVVGVESGVQRARDGRVSIDVRVADGAVAESVAASLRTLGGSVRHVSPDTASIRVDLPLLVVRQAAGLRGVVLVEPANQATTQQSIPADPRSQADPTVAPNTPDPESKNARAERVHQQLATALAERADQQPLAGPVTSEGDRAHAADTARERFRVTGVGVKICALSDGVDSLAASQAAGELPDVDVLPGNAGTGDEGTAMLEIIHDLAPGAELGFATAFISDGSFADNIRALRFDAGCDIVVDDILYFNESPFQDGVIARAVNDITDDGALFFSSAGNEGNTVDGTSGHWEGDFVNSGLGVGRFVGDAHDFDPGAGVQIVNPISNASSAAVPVTLFWSDPLGASTNDYDLYLLNASGAVVSFSQNVQDGTQDPYERLNTPAFGGVGLRVAVVQYSGEDRYLSLSALRGRFSDAADGARAFTTPGVTRGHSAAADAFSVAATPAAAELPGELEPGDPADPTGPFPGVFSADSRLERFSSDGPRRVFFAPDGTPLTPGDLSASGGQVRQKPDITAADGVSTSVPGFDTFFGTSAAAPHAAAIAGLVLSGNPGLAPDEVRAAFTATALDIAEPGVDGRAGAGVLLADRVLRYTGASPQPRAVAQEPQVVPSTGDGDAFLEPGESAVVVLPVRNTGDATAVSVSTVFTTSSAGVVLTPRARSYGTIRVGATTTRSFTLRVPRTHPVGEPVVLNARVSFAGALSPTSAPFEVPIGQPGPVRDFAYAGAPVAIPDGDPIGATVPIEVTGIGRVSSLTFSLDGATCSTAVGSTTVGIEHTYVGDLVGTLIAPDGTEATVFSGAGGSGNNLCKVVFDDAAQAPFSGVTAAQAPFSGTYRPAQAFAGLRGVSGDGTWGFRAVDTFAVDRGSLYAVSLHVAGYVTN